MVNALPVDQGRVQCPRAGDIDVDACYTCEYLDDVAQDGGGVTVMCAWRRSSVRLALSTR